MTNPFPPGPGGPPPEDEEFNPFGGEESAARKLARMISPAPPDTLIPLRPSPVSLAPQPSQVSGRATPVRPSAIGAGPISAGPPPDLGDTPMPRMAAPRGTVQGDTDEFNRLANSGSGVSQIRRPWLRALAGIGDVAGSVIAPNIVRFVPGTTMHHEQLLRQALGRVAADEQRRDSSLAAADRMADIGRLGSETANAEARTRELTPRPLTAQQAQAVGRPELVNAPVSAKDYRQMLSDYGRDQATRETHFGGQQRMLSPEDAEALGHREWSGMPMSNDEFQRQLAARGHDLQSGSNTRATNDTRIRTTAMNNAVSRENSIRAHSGAGGTGGTGGENPDLRQALIDEAAAKIDALDHGYQYDASTNTYKPVGTDSVLAAGLTPQQFTDKKNAIQAQLDARLTAKKLKPNAVRYKESDAEGSVIRDPATQQWIPNPAARKAQPAATQAPTTQAGDMVTVEMPDGSRRRGPRSALAELQKRFGDAVKIVQ